MNKIKEIIARAEQETGVDMSWTLKLADIEKPCDHENIEMGESMPLHYEDSTYVYYYCAGCNAPMYSYLDENGDKCWEKL